MIKFGVRFCLLIFAGTGTELAVLWVPPSNNKSNHLKSQITGVVFREPGAKLIHRVGLLPRGEGNARCLQQRGLWVGEYDYTQDSPLHGWTGKLRDV